MSDDPVYFSFHDPNQTELMRQLGLYIVSFSRWMHWLEPNITSLVHPQDAQARAVFAAAVFQKPSERRSFEALPDQDVNRAVLTALNEVTAGKALRVFMALCEHHGKTYWKPGEDTEAQVAAKAVKDCVDRRNRILHDSWTPMASAAYPAPGHDRAPVPGARQIRYVDSTPLMNEVTIQGLQDVMAALEPAFKRLFSCGWLLVDRIVDANPSWYVTVTG